jgi:hypothetical protein
VEFGFSVNATVDRDEPKRAEIMADLLRIGRNA